MIYDKRKIYFSLSCYTFTAQPLASFQLRMSRALRMSVLTRICDLSRFFGSKNELQYVILPILQNPQQLIIDLEAHGRAVLKSLRCRVK